MNIKTSQSMGRRDFVGLATGAVAFGPRLQPAMLAQAMLDANTGSTKRIGEDDPANIKLAHRLNAHSITDDELLFLKQIGIRWARLEFGMEETPFEYLHATQQRFARYGIRIFSGVHYSYRSLKVQLGQPGRDQDIETYRTFLRDLGRLEIPVASYDFHPANTYTTNQVERRGYIAREFNLSDFRAKIEKQRFEREYSAEEIWANYTYFIKTVLPVAEEAGVKLALHPDDPPLARMNGVAKLFVHYEGYHRAEQIAGSSRNWGLTFCVGTWSEGKNRMGKDVFEMIRDFGSRGKIFEVHFRNVSAPLPHFVETFPDDGYMDMYRVMKALREVRFSGAAEPDHIPQLTGDSGIRRAGTAYCIAYMRALLRLASE
ncbi:MAG TPA: mannonate dehydratase [Terriglobia bacterium]|nr:mannonate dehydratase [Terriglobia bacterium]